MQSANNLDREKSPTHAAADSSEDNYYMGKGSWRLTRFLSLQYFKVLPAYWSHYKKNKFLKYRPEYNKMIQNLYLWTLFRNMGANFNIYKQVFKAQQAPFITVIFISLIIGVLALFGAYYQRFLFAKFVDDDFETSGWVFFAIITTSAVLRFFLFNYVQNLANEIAINTRCYLQNILIRLLIHIPYEVSAGILINNVFVSVDLVNASIKFLPYFVSSLVIVFGIVGFIIGIVGHIGWVVLGLTITFILVELLILRHMLYLHEVYVHASDKRTSLLILGTQMLLKVTYSGLAKVFSKLVRKYRHTQTQIDRKYNLSDGVIQIMTESISFISVFIFYVVSEQTLRNTGQPTPTYRQILEAVILFSVFKTPIKMIGYGLSIGLEGYVGLHRIRQLLQLCEYVPPTHEDLTFPRIYPNPNCFQSELKVKGLPVTVNQIEVQPSALLQEHRGDLIMIVGKVDASPSCDKYLNSIQKSLIHTPYCVIGYNALLQDKSIRDNIIFGKEYNHDKYIQVLKVVNLKQKINKFPQGDETRMDENYFKTVYMGLSMKIEIARAIYSDVQVLVINRLIFKQFEQVLINVKQYRKQRQQTTLVVNLSGSHYNIADWIVVLGKDATEEGTYDDLIKTSTTLQQFETEYLSHIDLVTKVQPTHAQLMQPEEEPLDKVKVQWGSFFRFYNLSHYGAGVVLLVLLALPALMDLYLQVVVAESAREPKQDAVHASLVGAAQASPSKQAQISFDHIITLRYGIAALAFVLLNLLKITIFTIYLKVSAYKIVRNVVDSFLGSKIQTTISASNRKSALNLERNIQSLDNRITAQLDVGITIIFQQLTALIFGAVSSALFLAIGVPFFIVTILIIAIMVKYNGRLVYIRRQSRSRFNSFIKKMIIHRKTYVDYHMDSYVHSEFIRHNRADIQADFNKEWLLEALGIILEIMFILLLVITMAVSLVKYHEIHKSNEAFIQLAISFLIGLTNGGRTNLKIFQSMDLQLIGITSIFKAIDLHKQSRADQIKQFPDRRIFTLEYRDFTLRFRDDMLHQLNLTIKAGQRIVMTGSRTGGKRVAFYAVLGIFEPQHIRGDIYINRIPIYKDKITRGSLADMVHILENNSLSFVGDSIEDAIKIRAPRRDISQIQYTMGEMWKVLDVKPLFTPQTFVRDLSAAHRDLFCLVRALMIRPQILVLQGALAHIDTVSRRKLTKWLIGNAQISILIDLTNRIEAISEYPRLIQFKDGIIVKDTKNL